VYASLYVRGLLDFPPHPACHLNVPILIRITSIGRPAALFEIPRDSYPIARFARDFGINRIVAIGLSRHRERGSKARP
jgi:hypothetical protein